MQKVFHAYYFIILNAVKNLITQSKCYQILHFIQGGRAK